MQRICIETKGFEADMSGETVQELLGHETKAMTMKYQHSLKGQGKKERNKLEEIFNK